MKVTSEKKLEVGKEIFLLEDSEHEVKERQEGDGGLHEFKL